MEKELYSAIIENEEVKNELLKVVKGAVSKIDQKKLAEHLQEELRILVMWSRAV